jgi:hypothetical protein
MEFGKIGSEDISITRCQGCLQEVIINSMYKKYIGVDGIRECSKCRARNAEKAGGK